MVNKSRIVVIGSSNTDMVVRTPRLPLPGETVLGGRFSMVQGGKGANQAVAAARLEAHVIFVARVGTDMFGEAALQGFEAEGIDTRYIARDRDTPTGVALISVDETRGENSIVVAPGANGDLSVVDIERASEAIIGADVVMCQLEVPLETIAFALRTAFEAGVRTILNPAPAQPLPKGMLEHVSVLTPNETEAALLIGGTSASADEACRTLQAMGAREVVVTLGSKGAQVVGVESVCFSPSFEPPTIVDSTGAGDCFAAALAVALSEGQEWESSVRFANAAAALSVSAAGAQPSMPTRDEVIHFLLLNQ